MKKATPGRWLAAILAAILFAGTLTACGKEESGGSISPEPEGSAPSEPSKGRYVEQQEDLPQEITDCTIHQMFTADGRLRLLTSREKDERTLVLQQWEKQEDGFADVTPAWLSAMEFQCGGWLEAKLIHGSDGILYLYAGYVQDGEDSFLGHLWKGTGDTSQEITPEKWSVPNEEWGGYEMIQGTAALDNGNLAVLTYGSIDMVSGEDGKVLESKTLDSFYEGGVVTDGKNLYLCSSGENKGQIEKRADIKDDNVVTIPYPANISSDGSFVVGGAGSLALSALKDGTLVAAQEDGLFRLAPEADQWECLAKGIDTDFSVSNYRCTDLAALEDGSIFALFHTDSGCKLNRYVYDPDAVSEVTQVLKLYSVYENPLLKQAATLYHKAHPEVMINLEYEYPLYSGEEPDMDAVYKKVNTMLLGDDAPDLLVLDNLDMESYVSKGLLENVEDLIKPLEDKGDLLENITGVYREDGKRYVVPLQFTFPMALGRDIAPENMNSMEALADFLSQTDYSYMGTQTVPELVDKFYPYFCAEIVKDKQLDKEALGKYMDLLKTIGDNCGIIKSRPEDSLAYDIWNLGADAKLAFHSTKSFTNCMSPMSMVEYIKGNYTAFDNRFSPSSQLGICSKSPYSDTAKDFLLFALSQQVQDSDQYEGFPVNKASLQQQAVKDRSDYSMVNMIATDDGGYLQFEINPYPPETGRQLVELCESLNKPIKKDAKIRETLIECLEGFLDGTQSREDTIQKIEDGLKMYLAE